MKTEDIIHALNCLEMKGGDHVISEDLRHSILDQLSSTIAVKAPAKPIKRSPGRPRLKETPAVKGKAPE